MNKTKFDALPTEQQEALISAAKEAGAYQRQLNADKEAEMLAQMEKEGLQIIRDVDTTPFREAIGGEVRKMFIDQHGDVLPKAIDALAE